MNWYTLDFETKSRVNLITQGLDNYVRCPEFDAIVAVVKDRQTGERFTASSFGDCPLSVYDLLFPLLEDPTAQFIAHNATFEYVVCCVLAEWWGLPAPALSRFHCSSLSGACVGLPAGLDKVAGAVLGKNKVSAGSEHMKIFSIPNTKTGEFGTPETHPEEWAEYLYYAEVDVDLADELYDALPAVTDEVRTYWLATARMNLRGFLLDLSVVDMVLADVELIKADAAAVTKAITGGLVNKPTQRKRLLEFLDSKGVGAGAIPSDVVGMRRFLLAKGVKPYQLSEDKKELKAFIKELGYKDQSLTSAIVENWIRDPDTPEDIVELLWARLAASKSTFGKYAAFRRYASPDWRSRHSFWAAGTHTGRLAGKGVQPQNISYDKKKRFPSAAVLLERYLDNDWDESWDVSEALVAMTRACIMADDEFYTVDYAAIEARIQCWLANILWALRKYRNNEDMYIPMAATVLGIPVAQVTKEQRNQIGKVTVLGGGYGMGWAKFGATNGLDERTSRRCINSFRNTYSGIATYWGTLGEAFKACLVLNRRTKAQGPPDSAGTRAPVVRFRPDSIGDVHYIVCEPPGGRDIWYRNPAVSQSGQLSYERVTGKSTFRMDIWGGILLENICQNIAGVIISRGMIKVEIAGAPPVLQVHDELVCDASSDTDTKQLDALMTNIHGFPGLPLNVESKLAKRFSK